MNKFKLGALVYGGLLVVKTVSFISANRKLMQQQFEDVHGYQVLRDTGVMKLHGMKIASAMKFTSGHSRILVDEHFFKLPVHAQRFILAHEEGHIVLGHLEDISPLNTLKRTLIALGGVQDIELEADQYAADKCGIDVAIQGLQSLLHVRGVHKAEIKRRIHALEVKL